MPIRLGRVLASSGRTVDSNRRILDWAFVELRDPKANEHMGLNLLPDLAPALQPSRYVKTEVEFISSAVTTIGTIKPGEWYFKNGRTSQITAGVCNGVTAHCQWADSDKPRYDIAGDEVKSPTGAETKELVVLNKTRHVSAVHQANFCLPGDSGSWVINAQGALCGLLFAEATGWCGPSDDGSVCITAGIVSCMSTVSESVRAKTKGGSLSFG